MTARLRILAVPSAVGFAHVARLLLVAERLAASGHEVTFAFGGEDDGPIRAAGHAVVPAFDVAADPASDVYAAWSDDDAERAVREQAAMIAELAPDVVLADFHPTATIAAEAAGVPSVALVGAAFAPGAERLTGARGRLARAAALLLAARERGPARPFAAAARRLGQQDRETLAGVFRGSATLVTELASFADLEPMPAGYEVTGPLVYEEAGTAPPAPPPGTTRVYATIGNTGDPRLIDLAVEALAGRDGLQLVVTTGRLAPAPAGLPDDVVWARTLPGGAVLRDSRLAIHPGGSGTTYQALAAGVPMLVVPAVSGQAIAARLVSRHGVGAGYRLDQLSPERLRAATGAFLLEGGARRRAQAFARELAGTDGPGAAAAAVVRAHALTS